MFRPVIEYVDEADIVLPPPVKKQVWNGEKFVPMTLYRWPGLTNHEQRSWLEENIGPPGVYRDGQYWDHSRAGSFTVMDEKVFVWFQLKWAKK